MSATHGYLIARLVVCGRPFGDNAVLAESALLACLRQMKRAGQRAKFLITPGGFVDAPWPLKWKGTPGWGSSKADLEPLKAAAAELVARVVTRRVFEAARGIVEVITIGVDLNEADTLRRPHAELVCVYDVGARRCVAVTGKSYSSTSQHDMLVHVTELESHLVKVAGERVLVLGCHDLNLYSPRAWANHAPDGERRRRTLEFRKAAARFNPTVVLHHPHSTDTPRIWSSTWGPLIAHFPALKGWASGINYWNHGKPERAELARVLAGTRSGDNVLDVLFEA